MKTEDIIRMAREAGMVRVTSPSGIELGQWWGVELVDIERFAALVATAEREAVLQTIEALYDTQDPNPMYKEGYNHALDNIEEFIKGRANATLSEQGDKHET